MSLFCSELSFHWPDGEVVLDGVDMATGAGRTGLIGTNGSGKSTLLKLIAGELTPTEGSVHVSGQLGYLSQELAVRVESRIDEVLDIADKRAAVWAIENGDASEENFALIGNDWDVAERAGDAGQAGVRAARARSRGRWHLRR